MADDITDTISGAPELAARDLPFNGAQNDDTPLEDRSSSVLDELLKTKTAEKTPEEPAETIDPEKDAADKKAADEAKAAAEKKPEKPDPAAEKKAADEKAAADKKTAEDKKTNEPQDALSKITLGPHAKPATVESFNKVKEIARAETAKVRAELSTVKAENEELKKKTSAKIDPVIEKELKDLREFKSTFAYEKSDEFIGKFEKPLAETEKGIFDRLAKIGLDSKSVDEIKKIGLDNLDWGNLFEKVKNPVTQRSIEALLLKREQLIEGKTKELADAATKPAEYAAKQKQAEEATKKESNERFTKTYREYLDKVPWSKKAEIPTTATAEERLQLENQNKFAEAQETRLKHILATKDTPEGLADMVSASLFAYAMKERLENTEADLKAATEELAKIKKATSTTRAARSAPAASTVKTETKQDLFFTRGDDALDSLRKQKESASE